MQFVQEDSSLPFPRQHNSNGSVNPLYVDLLEEDKPISGQKFACVSFVSPENILKKKEHFLFEEFLKHFDFSKSVQKFTQFLNFLCLIHLLYDFALILLFFRNKNLQF